MTTKKMTEYKLTLKESDGLVDKYYVYVFPYTEGKCFFIALCYDKMREYFALNKSDKNIIVRMHNYEVPDSHKVKRVRKGVRIDNTWTEDTYTRFDDMIASNVNEANVSWMTVEVV